jgi:hypothetical protein
MEITFLDQTAKISVNKRSIMCSGTCLQGYIDCSYQELIDKLGEPEEGDGDKTRADWAIQATIGDEKFVATLYDWKEYRPLEEVPTWNIGGFNADAVRLLKALFPDKYVRGRGF